ncbi:6-bladed beta-propeller [uncultured Fibrella sp.]|uniref:6-bladed beta-propeller n=1 Tax=uncultured Fibrella sp. TaxID=1284596 RepID=UPI0035C95DA1
MNLCKFYKIFTIWLIICCISYACNSNNNDSNSQFYTSSASQSNVQKNGKLTSISVDISLKGIVNYSDIFSNIDYKILSSPKGILVGKVDKLVNADSLFFLKSNGKIFIFTYTGQFLSKIDQQGEAPNQYRAITDFIVDTKNKKVQVLDNHSFSVFEFNYKGQLIRNWKHGILSFQFQQTSPEEYLFYADKELVSSYNGRFLLYNKLKERVLSYYLPIDKRRIKYEGFLDVNNFYRYKNELLISCSGNDTIFSYKSGIINPKYVFNFGTKAVSNDFYDKNMESVVDFNNARIKNEFAGLYYNSFAENDNILITQIVQAKSVYYLWFNKNKQNYYLIDQFADDLVFKGTRIRVGETFPMYFSDKKAFRILEPEVVINTLDSIRKSSSTDGWNKLISTNSNIALLHKNVNLTSNPVIMIMTYK